MTFGARELLCRMVEAVDQGHRNYFDSCFYIGFPEAVLSELDDAGMIEDLNNIAGGVKLTAEGYTFVKK